MDRMFPTVMTVLATLALVLGQTAHAGSFIYPSKGQNAEQQAKDEGACNEWAKQQTGVDPAVIAQQSLSGQAFVQPQGGFHSLLGGATAGAALGAIGGAIGGDAGEGAAIGSAVGAVGSLFQARRRVREQDQYNNAITQEQQARLNEYNQAYTTCLRGRGYTVSD
jgi:hypothetical protein